MISHEEFAGWARWAWLLAADHLWQTAVFALLALAAAALLRSGPARLRSAVWLAALVKLALPLSLFAYLGAAVGLEPTPGPERERAGGVSIAWALVEPVGAAVGPADAPGPRPAGHGELYCLLTAAWLAGLAASAGLRWSERRRVALAVRAGRRLGSGREVEALARARARLGVGRAVGVVVSPGIDEPGVWRVRRPVVVLPEGVGDGLDDDELEAVMMHEAAHVARRDNLAAALQTALRCAFWFFPVVWLVDRRLLAERERACDEAVLEAGGGARTYAAGLLKVFRFSIGWRPAGVSCATGSHLGRRIEQIMGNNTHKSATIWHRAVIASVVAVMTGASATAAAYGLQEGKRVAKRDVIIAQKHDGPAGNEAVVEAAQLAPTERVVPVDYSAGGPVQITDAQIKLVPAEKLAATPGGGTLVGRRVFREAETEDVLADVEAAPAEGNALRVRPFPEADANGNVRVLLVTLTNTSDKIVNSYQFGGGSAAQDDGNKRIRFFFMKPIEPGASETFAVPVMGPALTDDFTLSVAGAQFADGTTWGEVETGQHGRLFVKRLPDGHTFHVEAERVE